MMTNDELADELRDLANLMIVAGQDEFRARRYARLADDIEYMAEAVWALAEKGKLTEIKGVGGSTATAIVQYLETGTCDKRKELEEIVPATALDLLQISGIGAKTARRFFCELSIANIDELEAALDSGALVKMKGVTKKTEEKFRAGIARIRRRNFERPLQETLSICEQVGEALNLGPATRAIAVAGDARRGRDMARGAHTVAATENIGEAATLLHKIGLGDGTPRPDVRGEFGGGFPIRVTLNPPRVFGVTWLRETADREHLDALNERARASGLPPLDDVVNWADQDETQIYAQLGLPFIPPELREGTRALERADSGGLPALIQREDYQGDLHTHTRASDGANSIEEMAEAAAALGHKYLTISDHSRSSGHAGGLSAERLERQIDEVHAVNDALSGKITLLAGSEVDILPDGKLDYPDSLLERLDWVVASVHSLFNLSENDQTARICRAMENPYVRVIGHPTGRRLGIRDPYAVDAPALIEKAAETGVALELNSSPSRLDLNAAYCGMAREAGVAISLNTDAHRTQTLDNLKYGLTTARRAWLEPRHVINTRSLEDIRAFRSEARP